MTSNSWLMLIVTCGEEREGRERRRGKEREERERKRKERERDTNKTLIKGQFFIKN